MGWNSIRNKIFSILNTVKHKITFLPTLISIGAFLIGIILITFRNTEIEYFLFKIPLVRIHEIETLRAILIAFFMGLISITIFSFSMVMLVLSQAASQYSPKILNWMIGKRSNQYILGVYFGTIIFTMLLIIQLPEDVEMKPLYHFAVVLDAIFTFYSLTLFVTFINNVSNDIQISNIIEGIYRKTSDKLSRELDNNQKEDVPQNNVGNWIQYNSNKSGYLQNINNGHLINILENNDLKIEIVQNFGYYHITGNPLYKLNRKIEDEEVHEAIRGTFMFYSGEKIQDHTFYGFRQLSEIAVKALSPGINDTGTASICIDYLTDLFARKMENNHPNIVQDKGGVNRIFIHTYSFSELFQICFIPILNYGNKDITILNNFLISIIKLAMKDEDRKYIRVLNAFLEAVLESIFQQKHTPYFYNYLLVNIQVLQNLPGYSVNIPDTLNLDYEQNQ